MKIKDGYIIRNIADNWIVVPLGEKVVEFNGLLSLNETAAFLWRQLENECDEDDLCSALMSEFEVDELTAKKDIDEFLQTLKDKKLI